MAYHSSVGCDLGGDQPTGYATPSTCFHTPEITITRKTVKLDEASDSRFSDYLSGLADFSYRADGNNQKIGPGQNQTDDKACEEFRFQATKVPFGLWL
jgi:hypothetical protein